jgi:hypothetical protein
MFGCASSEGRLEIWNLQQSVYVIFNKVRTMDKLIIAHRLDPIIVQSVLDRQLTSILFASQSPIILTGDDNGVVNVYKLVKLSGGEHLSEQKGGTLDSDWFQKQASILQKVLDSKKDLV